MADSLPLMLVTPQKYPTRIPGANLLVWNTAEGGGIVTPKSPENSPAHAPNFESWRMTG